MRVLRIVLAFAAQVVVGFFILRGGTAVFGGGNVAWIIVSIAVMLFAQFCVWTTLIPASLLKTSL